MKTLTFLYLLLILTLFSCNQNSKNDNGIKIVKDTKGKIIPKKNKDTCDLKAMIIAESKSKKDKTKIIYKPVAIAFFNLINYLKNMMVVTKILFQKN